MERLEPPVSEEAAPFWAATRAQQLVLQWCRSCERPVWYPRAACPRCLGGNLEWRSAAGLGSVHAVSVMTRPANPTMAGREPYAVALVDLDEGVRLMSNVVGGDPWQVAVGDRVRLAWEPLPDGRHLYLFEKEDGA